MIVKKSLFILPFILGLLVFKVSAQQSTEGPQKAIESIVGKWQLQKVYAGSREITANPNAERQSSIEFNEDGTYRLQAEDEDNGSYRLNENHSVLYLESQQKSETSSAVNTPNLSEYNITIRNGTLTMQSKEGTSPSTRYVYARAGQAAEGEDK
jgi:outer membrane lipoprotein-sorting protein